MPGYGWSFLILSDVRKLRIFGYFYEVFKSLDFDSNVFHIFFINNIVTII